MKREALIYNSGFNKVETIQLLLDQLELGRFTPRKGINQRYVDELAESLENESQFKPIIVRPHPRKEEIYEVIDGEHRVRALRKLGRTYVRTEIRAINDEDADLLALRVNQMHGRRLDALEEGLHIQKIIEMHCVSQEVLGERLGRSQQWVSQRLKLARDSCDELIEAFTTRARVRLR